MATARKRPATSSSSGGAAAVEKDPKGGLTAAGRAAFARKDGSHLKPGVTASDAEMSPEDMKRKGSWAVRFYGRDPLPPLVDAKGEPTRFALSAHAWGEPVPKTEAAARKIAAKGRKLLERYEATKRTGAAGSGKASSAPAKKAAAKKTPARKSPAKKAPAGKASGDSMSTSRTRAKKTAA